jgi:aryl-alcohol dehydrogenase-like predicted oxidoreductase
MNKNPDAFPLVSPITLGTVQLGMEYGIANSLGQPNNGLAEEILQTAFDSGIYTFDTSIDYGTSEQRIGAFIRQLPSIRQPQVVTKFNLSTNQPLSNDAIKEQVFRQAEQSLKNLGLKQLPVYLFHAGMHHSMDAYLAPVSLALEALKNEGLVEKGGVSLYFPEDLEYLNHSDVLEFVQLPVNLFDQRLIISEALDQAIKSNKTICARSVYLQGLFFKDPESLSATFEKGLPYLKQLQQLASDFSISVKELAFVYVRDLEGINSLVIGAESPEQVRVNSKLLESPPLTQELRHLIHKTFEGIPDNIIIPGLWTNTKK